MGKLKVKAKAGASGRSKSPKNGRMISDEEIRQRAFEISLENGNSTNDLDNWFKAEAELRGF